MLESALKEQLKGIFAGLEANFTFDISVSSSHENKTELLELLGDVADCSDHITCSVNEGEALKFTLLKNSDYISLHCPLTNYMFVVCLFYIFCFIGNAFVGSYRGICKVDVPFKGTTMYVIHYVLFYLIYLFIN